MSALPADALDDCFLHDSDRLTHAKAVALIAGHAAVSVGREVVSLAEACGRYAASDIVADRPVPGHDNAAVDGFAVRHADLAPDHPTTLEVVGRIAAGDALESAIGPGEAIRIFTGARVPTGADTIVMQEDATAGPDGTVTIPAGIRARANLRRAGEDVEPDEVIVRAGDRLRPQDVAALASVGRARVEVHARLRIGILSSGDEIRRPGTPLSEAQVYDANSYLLRALTASLPVEAVDLGIAADRREEVEATLTRAARGLDLIITSGGASRGEEDHMVRTIAEKGTLHAWQIAVKPGRPLGFGRLGQARVLMLPGNPVAVMVCFLLYAMPLIARLGGGRPAEPRRFMLPAVFAMPSKKAGRREFLRGILAERDGRMAVDKFPRDGSGLISSLRAADGLIEITEPVTRVAPGDMVAFIPFAGFGLPTG